MPFFGVKRTCKNWTSNTVGTAMLGHSDRSWNSSHPSSDCSQDGLKTTDGAGLFYRFATNWRAAENTLLRFKVGTANVGAPQFAEPSCSFRERNDA